MSISAYTRSQLQAALCNVTATSELVAAIDAAGAGGGGSGTVTSVSVVSANGFGGSVATATTTPAITLTTSVNGILLGNGTGVSALTLGTGLSLSGGTLSVPTSNSLTLGLVSQGTGILISGGVASLATPLVINTHTAPITTDTDGATITFDLSLTDWHQVTLGGSRTLALASPTTGQVFYLKLIQDSTGSRTVTWFSGITWYTSTFAAPTLPTGAAKAILCGFRCTGSGAYDGFVVGASGS